MNFRAHWAKKKVLIRFNYTAMVRNTAGLFKFTFYSSRFKSGQMGQSESRKELGLDLVQGAKNLPDFLVLVDEHPSLFSCPVLKNVIRRYEHLRLPL